MLCDCEKCKKVDITKPATFTNCCFKGTLLLKNHLQGINEPIERKRKEAINRRDKLAFEDTNKTTKKKLAEVMRYVGDE